MCRREVTWWSPRPRTISTGRRGGIRLSVRSTMPRRVKRSPWTCGCSATPQFRGPSWTPRASLWQALACTLVTWNGDYRNEYRWVTTDAQGHFALRTGHVAEGLSLDVAHGDYGYARVSLREPLGEGGRSPDLHIVLPGVARVRGVVSGRAGKGIAGVRCEPLWAYTFGVTTDAQGRFDLGLLSVPLDSRSSLLSLTPPRPVYALLMSGDQGATWAPATQTDPDHQVFYEPSRQTVTQQPGKTVDLAIRLKETELLTIRGQIVDLAGKPVPHASAYLYAGTPSAGSVDWAIPWISGGSMMLITDKPLGGSTVDAQGRFRAFVVRSDGAATQMGTRYAIGVVSDGKARKLVPDVIVPPDKHEVDVKIQIDPTVALDRHGTRSTSTGAMNLPGPVDAASRPAAPAP